MPGHGIAGSPGTEPEQPQPTPPGSTGGDGSAGGGSDPTLVDAVARLVVDRGVVFVELDGRRARLATDDVRRLGLAPVGAASGAPPALASAIEAATTYRDMLLQLPGVIAVRAGYKFVAGEITDRPAVVVSVDRKVSRPPRGRAIPRVLPDGTPTDVTVATPIERLAEVDEVAASLLRTPLLIDQVQAPADELAAVLEAVPIITYQPPAGASLNPVTGPMAITCHVSPDAGWRVLKPFLEATQDHVTLGMYDFTAPHIYRSVRSVLKRPGVTWQQTLDPGESLPKPDEVDSNKADDKPEASINRGLRRVAGARFETAFAHTGSGGTFASAYHIKVAVRDDAAFWLSSGNWQSSNQCPVDLLEPGADRSLLTEYNREWHVVVESAALADTFQRYLAGDYETAVSTPEAAEEAAVMTGPDLLVPVDEPLVEEASPADLQVFAPKTFTFDAAHPLTVQPILTPDNYLDVVLPLLRQKPKHRLYFQNQSLNPIKTPTPRWAELLSLLAGYSNDPALDVRIIFRAFIDVRKARESLQLAGFNMDRVKHQVDCHTKGILIDSKTVVLGSHNWTNQGVEANRDASLLIHHAGIAGYYEQVFLQDWEHLATTKVNEHATPGIVAPGQEAATATAAIEGAFVRVPWTDFVED